MGKIISAQNSKILREELAKETIKESKKQEEQQVEAPKKRGRRPKKEKTNCSCKAKGEDMSPGGVVPHRQASIQSKSGGPKWQYRILHRINRRNI